MMADQLEDSDHSLQSVGKLGSFRQPDLNACYRCTWMPPVVGALHLKSIRIGDGFFQKC